MAKVKIIIATLLLLIFPAQAQMSKSAIQSQIILNWPDNNNNAITASKLRIPNQIIVNSYLDLNGAASFQCPANQVMIGFSTLSAPSCSLISGFLTTTGTGAFVLANSPILVTPNLGTPSVVILTNGTGLPVSTGIVGLGTGISTALATNVGTAGSVVINGGALGTPSSGTLTSATGLPVSSGISGLGTGVATALGVAIGSAGSPIVNGGVLGTPSSGVGTNLTALNASNLSSGTLPAARLPLTNTSFSAAAATPTALSAGTAVMIGAGVTNCKLTPTYSGRVRVQFDMASSNPGGASFGIVYSLRYGTGTAPANNAAVTGTAASGPFTYTSAAGNTTPTTLSAVVTGLTPGTAYWFDIAQTSNGAVAVTANYGCNGFEF